MKPLSELNRQETEERGHRIKYLIQVCRRKIDESNWKEQGDWIDRLYKLQLALDKTRQHYKQLK